MARHGFGQGEYQYFGYPLPGMVQDLRENLYARLAPIANRWRALLGQTGTFPASLAEFSAECAAAGQTRPTPLLLKYGPGDYNRLHQDVYGERLFPFQVVVLLSAAGPGFFGRRTGARRAKAPVAVARHGGAAGARPGGGLRGPSSAGPGQQRHLQGGPAARGQHGAGRAAASPSA